MKCQIIQMIYVAKKRTEGEQ